VLKKV